MSRLGEGVLGRASKELLSSCSTIKETAAAIPQGQAYQWLGTLGFQFKAHGDS